MSLKSKKNAAIPTLVDGTISFYVTHRNGTIQSTRLIVQQACVEHMQYVFKWF